MTAHDIWNIQRSLDHVIDELAKNAANTLMQEIVKRIEGTEIHTANNDVRQMLMNSVEHTFNLAFNLALCNADLNEQSNHL